MTTPKEQQNENKITFCTCLIHKQRQSPVVPGHSQKSNCY